MRFPKLSVRLFHLLYLPRKQYVLSLITGVCIAVGLYATVVRVGKAKQAPLQKPSIASLPSISSCTKTITIENAFFKNPDSPSGGMLVLQLRNNTDIAVIAISIESSSKTDHSEFKNITNSFEDDKPTVLMGARGSGEFTMEVANIRPDGVVKVGSVTFADGKEDGCRGSLKSMHDSKSWHEARKAARKASKESQ